MSTEGCLITYRISPGPTQTTSRVQRAVSLRPEYLQDQPRLPHEYRGLFHYVQNISRTNPDYLTSTDGCFITSRISSGPTQTPSWILRAVPLRQEYIQDLPRLQHVYKGRFHYLQNIFRAYPDYNMSKGGCFITFRISPGPTQTNSSVQWFVKSCLVL
jgi:hypothetical protein